MSNQDETIGASFIAACRHRFSQAMATIEHCLRQLPEEDLHWRPFEGHNSLATIVLHLCGNVRQWIISGVGGAPDTRERQREFDDRTPYSREQLLERLHRTIDEADAVLAALPPEKLLAERRIQGFDVTAMTALVDTVSHFVGHTQEIIYVTRLRCEDAYVFRWVPKDEEPGVRKSAGQSAGQKA